MILTRMAVATVLRAIGTLVAVLIAGPATWVVERTADAANHIERFR